MKSRPLPILPIFSLFISLTLFGGDLNSQVKKPLDKKIKIRRLASLSPERSQIRIRSKAANYIKSEDDIHLRAGLLGGFSSPYGKVLGGSQNISIGLNVDLTAWTYFGIEAEGFYALPSSSTTAATTSTAVTSKYHNYMTHLKGQLPFYTGAVRWAPKLGLGYGLVNLNSSGTGLVETTQEAKGIYFVAGFDVEPLSDLIVGFDYSRSAITSGTVKFSLSGTTTNGEIESPLFERIRLTTMYRIFPHILFGMQYVQRKLDTTLSITGATGAPATTIHQVLGVLNYEL